MFCVRALSLLYVSLCVTVSTFILKAFQLSFIIICCPIKEKCRKRQRRQTEARAGEEKVRTKVFRIVLSSGFVTLYWCGLYLSNISEAESWIIEALFVIKVKLKQHTSTHPSRPARIHPLLYLRGPRCHTLNTPPPLCAAATLWSLVWNVGAWYRFVLPC